MQRRIAILALALTTACFCRAAERNGEAIEVDKPTERILAKWQAAWNGGKPEAFLPLYHPESAFQDFLKVASDQVKQRFAEWMKGYGKMGAMRVVGLYENGTACAVRADFAGNKDFPFVLLLKKQGDEFMVDDFFPGQDPSMKADEQVIAEFLKGWQKAWNSGDGIALFDLGHPFSTMALAVAGGHIQKEEIATRSKDMFQEFGDIQSAKLRGYKARTNEYVVDFTYAKAGRLTAAINLQKDGKGAWRVFRLDVDSGERALENPKSWHCQ